MKKTLKLLVILFGFAIITPGITSCESKAQKEARAKADAEKQRIKEQIQSSDGLRQYLKGKTFAYDKDYQYRWIKLSFTDTNAAIIYIASSKDRNWGKGKKCTYKVEDMTDNYGKKNGYTITLKGDGIYPHTLYHLYLSDYSRLGTMAVDSFFYSMTLDIIRLDQTETNYIPIQWRD